MNLQDLITIHQWYIDNTSQINEFICSLPSWINLPDQDKKKRDYPLMQLEQPVQWVNDERMNQITFTTSISKLMPENSSETEINEVLNELINQANKYVVYLKNFYYINNNELIISNLLDFQLIQPTTIVSEVYKRDDVLAMVMIEVTINANKTNNLCSIDWYPYQLIVMVQPTDITATTQEILTDLPRLKEEDIVNVLTNTGLLTLFTEAELTTVSDLINTVNQRESNVILEDTINRYPIY